MKLALVKLFFIKLYGLCDQVRSIQELVH